LSLARMASLTAESISVLIWEDIGCRLRAP
jgi:hypothetical protein